MVVAINNLAFSIGALHQTIIIPIRQLLFKQGCGNGQMRCEANKIITENLRIAENSRNSTPHRLSDGPATHPTTPCLQAAFELQNQQLVIASTEPLAATHFKFIIELVLLIGQLWLASTHPPPNPLITLNISTSFRGAEDHPPLQPLFMNNFLVLSLLLITAYSQTCSNIPADHVYYLTDFCGPAPTACDKYCGNCSWAYTADSQRFWCGAVLNCVRNGKSMNLDVVDYGPACSLETKSDKPIIDASVSTCQYLTGGSSCGWSDKFSVICKKVSAARNAHLLVKGSCTWNMQQASEEVPYCHIPQMAGYYNFENIGEWISHQSMLQSEQ